MPRWAKAKYPYIPSVGAFEYEVFDPENWVPEYPNPAFINMNSDDAFWAAKQVMAFSDDDIRAIVGTGEYTDAAATDWVVSCLIERRNKIGKAFFQRVLPVDKFAVRDGRLTYEDLNATHFGTRSESQCSGIHSITIRAKWNRIEGATTLSVPNVDGEYIAAELNGMGRVVRVYLRRSIDKQTWEVVGRDTAAPEPRLLTKR